MKEARKIVNDYCRANIPYLALHRRDELTDFVIEKALLASMRFDPDKPTKKYGQNGGKHFDSWICDEMWNRCIDWLRSKAEGNGDRRYSNDNRIFLAGDTLDDEPDPDLEGKFISERKLVRWQKAAKLVGMTMEEWIPVTLDKAARRIEKTKAAA